MFERAVLLVLGVLAAMTVFVITFILIEFKGQILTEEPIWTRQLGNIVQLAIIAVALQFLPLYVLVRRLRSYPSHAAYPSAGVVGAVTGFMAIFVMWAIFGGWGPPNPLPYMAAGTVFSPAVLAVRRVKGGDQRVANS